MRYAFVTLFMFLFCVGSLYAQDKQKTNNENAASVAKIQAIQQQLIKQKQDSIKLGTLRDVGYGYQKSSNITGSVSSVNTNGPQKSGYSDIYQYLQGRVSGLMVLKSGAGYTIRIRGMTNSFSGSSEPLIVLNGTPLSSADDIQYIDPSNVKSIEVLKDAASASIYGVRAANGVILIRTN